MSTLVSVETEANIAECSESRSFRVQEHRDDHLSELQIWQNEPILDEAFSFQIRHFVSTVRQTDFSKCWPFRQKLLEKCLSVGLKPFLPPFEPPLKVCDIGEHDNGLPVSRLQQCSSSREDEGFCEENEGQDLSNGNQDGYASALIEKLPPEDQEIVGTNFSKDSDGDCSTGVDLVKPSTVQLVQEDAGITDCERLQDNLNNEFGTHANTSLSDANRSDCGKATGNSGNMSLSSAPLHTETATSITIKDANCQSSSHNELESNSALETGVSFNGSKGGPLGNIQQYHKGKFKLLSNESTKSEEQQDSFKAKPSKVGTFGKVLRDEVELSCERLTNLDDATASCIERNTVGFPPRLEKNIRSGDDSSFTGLNLDTLVPQVCPVCLNFTSTSNTALNAHIDHCLESVLPGEKGESRINKHKIKPRKMRSMVDICATAPTRTLEDLERSSKLWALNDVTSKEESSHSPSWNSGLVRRQPRTSLHRGLAWKARSSLETDHEAPQVSGSEPQTQLDKSQGECFIGKQHEINGWTHAKATPYEQPFEDQQLEPEGPSITLQAASPVHVGQISLAKKKKKRGLTSVISTKEVLITDECSLSNKYDKHQSRSISLDLLGFTIIDTSAEEERRLLQKAKCVDGEETGAGKFSQEGFVEDVGSNSGKFNKQQFPKGPPLSVLTSKKPDYRSSNEIPKKRSRTPIVESEGILNNGEISGEDDEDVLQLLSERPTKSKKAAPKIKSLLTVVANSCKEKEKDASEGLGGQKLNEVQERSTVSGVNTAPSSGLSGSQEARSKRRSLASVQEDTREGFCELSKRARFTPEQPAPSEELHLLSMSEHGKSPKQSSLSSGRVLIEEEELYTDCPQQEIRQCLLVELEDGSLHEEGVGSLTSLLSTHQAEGEAISHALETRNNVMAVASTKDVFVKTPLCTTDISGLSEIGALCRSGSDSLRKSSTNAPSNKVCVDNREEVSRKTSNYAEQTVKSHQPVSQSPIVGNSSGSSPFATASNFKLVDTDPRHRPQMLPAKLKSFLSDNVVNSRPVDNYRTKQPLYESLAAPNFPTPVARDSESSLGNLTSQWYESTQSLAPGIRILKDFGLPQAAAEGLENSGLRSSAPHSTRQALRAGDSYERSGLNSIDSPVNRENVRILDNGNHLVINKMDHIQGHCSMTETLQRGTVSSKVPSHHQQSYSGSRLLRSESGPVILSSASESLHENGHVGNCDRNLYDYAPMSAISSERMSLPSGLLADLARSMATDARKAQDNLHRSNGFSGEEQRTLQGPYHSTTKNPTNGREFLNLLPRQGTGKSYVPSACNGNVQPHVLHTAVQALKANTPMRNPECVNGMGGSVDVSRKVHHTLPPVSSFRADPSSSCINGTRESFLGAELASNFSNYGTVEYPVDQGVVHIFGNPVFKLMGQNVLVTSNSIKALGSCDQNGVQRFHPSSSIRHLGVLPETQSHYARNLTPELYSSSRLEAWHGDPRMSSSNSFVMDNLEVHPQAPQTLPPTKSVHSKLPAYKDPVIFKPQMPMCILEEGPGSSRSTRELVMKKLAVGTPGSKMGTQVVVDTLPGASNSLPAGLSRSSGIVGQHSGRQFTMNNCSMPQSEQQSRAFTLQSTSATHLEDIHTPEGARYRSGSGTLADIVHGSERSNN